MMEGQGEHPEGWEARDARSGVAKVFEEAKDRTTLGVQVAVGWAVLTLVWGLLDFTGATAVTPPLWDVTAGIGAGVLGSLALSRTPGPLLAAATAVLVDLAVAAFHFPEMVDHGSVGDHVAAGVRLIVAPVVIVFLLNGYFGALSIQAFKAGFSPGADWRTRINPRTVQIGIVLSCLVALVAGVGSWAGAVRAGFAQTDVVWATKYLVDKTVQIETARPKVEEARTDGEKPGGVKFDIKVLEEPKVPAIIPYPEAAVPVTSIEGLDEFTKVEVEDAWYDAADLDEAGCVLEGHGRQDRCRDDRCKHWARFFVRACLVKSRKTPKFCDGVPDVTDGIKGEEWAQRLCAGRNLATCRELLFAVQGHCRPPKPGEAVVPTPAVAGK